MKSSKAPLKRPPRRPPSGGYARGDETRRRIIIAGIQLFGERGFEAASTRDVAALAGVNAPALQYYFMNKEGLFKACTEYAADSGWAAFEPAILRAKTVLRTDATTPILIDTFCRILEAIADQMFSRELLPGQIKFVARLNAGLESAEGAELITVRIRHPLNEACTELMSRITGSAVNAPITALRVLSLLGQNQTFRSANWEGFPNLGWKEVNGGKAEMIKATIREQTTVLLEHWSRERTLRPRVPKEEIGFPAPRRRSAA